MRSLFANIAKDTKLIMRNWHTIVSFMVLPFVLVLIIGFIFGTSGTASIPIGFENLDPSVLPDLNEIDTIVVDSCERDFVAEDLHACIREESGRISVSIDNSRTNSYAYTVSIIQQAIAKENDQAALVSIASFQSDLESQVELLVRAVERIEAVEASIAEANESVRALEASLDATGNELTRERVSLYETRTELEALNEEFDAESDSIEDQLDDFEQELIDLDANLTYLQAALGPGSTAQIDVLRGEIDNSFDLIDDIRSTISTVDASQNIVLSKVVSSSERLDELIASLDTYTERIAVQQELIAALDATADELGIELGSVATGTQEALGFSPDELLNSLSANYEFYYNTDMRLLILPIVIMMILVFLSTVIGSLLTHQELTSPAMVRIELTNSSRGLIDLSKALLVTTIVLVNVIIMFLIALFAWNGTFTAQIPMLVIASVPAIITFALIGASLAYAIRRPFVLFVTATFVAMVFIISSGILRAPEFLDPSRAVLITYNPATMFLETTRVLVLGGPSGSLLGPIIWVGVSIGIITLARFSWRMSVFRD